jgi:hypothetical protein
VGEVAVVVMFSGSTWALERLPVQSGDRFDLERQRKGDVKSAFVIVKN